MGAPPAGVGHSAARRRRARIGGDDEWARGLAAGGRIFEIVAGSDHGLFRPDSMTWRIGRESVLLMGGGRALILQVAHPQVAAGVAQFSDYRADPWRRLYRTLDTTLKIVFGDAETSSAAARRLRSLHARVRGTDDRGRRYFALDPELLMWVHATLIETAILIYERYVTALTPREKSLYYLETLRLGRLFGIPSDAQPSDYPAFRRYWAAMLASGLRVTDTTREVADSVLDPPLPGVAWPAVEAIRLVTAGTLPEELRERLGIEWGPTRERLLRASERGIRALMPTFPSLVRSLPHARAAERRVAG